MENLEKKVSSAGVVRNIALPCWFLSFWEQASLSSTPASLAPAYPCGPIPSEASAAPPFLNSHIKIFLKYTLNYVCFCVIVGMTVVESTDKVITATHV